MWWCKRLTIILEVASIDVYRQIAPEIGVVAKHVQPPAFFRDFRDEKKHKAVAQGEWTHRAGVRRGEVVWVVAAKKILLKV